MPQMDVFRLHYTSVSFISFGSFMALDIRISRNLHISAAQCHRPLLAEILIQAGADKSALDADGLTPADCCDDAELREKLTP